MDEYESDLNLLSRIHVKPKDDKRRKLSYFGHKDDGSGTLHVRSFDLPTFLYTAEMPLSMKPKHPPEDEKNFVDCKLRVKGDQNLKRFLVVPERKNVWHGGIRSQCEGVLTAKTYTNTEEDKGVYTVIPEIIGSKITVEAVYRMWLALENAMIRRECLIIVEDPALSKVTKFRTEQWCLLNKFVRLGSTVTILFSYFFYQYPSLYLFPLSLAFYGFGLLNTMGKKDPASRYSECSINKQYEQDPDSYVVCDAHISMKYLRSPSYRMFKLEGQEERDSENMTFMSLAFTSGAAALIYRLSSLPLRNEVVKRGLTGMLLVPTKQPMNIFEQLRNRFLTFGRTLGPGRTDTVHWMVQNFLVYYLFLRHIPWAIQSVLEYLEREYVMETSIRYLQFRNLQGDERYEFPARNLYWTMQKDYPNNRILKEMYDHYNCPPEDYYESADFLETRESHQVTLKEAIRRAKISYYRNW